MHRWAALLFFCMAAGFIALVFLSRGAPDIHAPVRYDGMPSAPAHLSAPVPPAIPSHPAPVALSQPAGDGGGSSDGQTLPSGELATGSPASGPKQVTFGVLLVSYQGAEGAVATARTRAEALGLASQLTLQAKQDFAAAVKKADLGFENAGTIQRGVLEPAPEQVLFNLQPGEVGGPVDSPRGFYVFVRID